MPHFPVKCLSMKICYVDVIVEMYNILYNSCMGDLKEILWEGGSYEDLLSFPEDVRHNMGYQLHLIQSGEMPQDWKMLSGLGKGISGVYEVRVSDGSNIFRTAYVAKFADVVAVLHCWQKKTQKTSESDKATIVKRYRAVQEYLND